MTYPIMEREGQYMTTSSSGHMDSLFLLDVARVLKYRPALVAELFIFIIFTLKQITLWPKICHKEGPVMASRTEVK